MAKHKVRSTEELKGIPVERWTLNEIRKQACDAVTGVKGEIVTRTLMAQVNAEDEDAEYCYDAFYDKDLTAGWKVELSRYRAALRGLMSELEKVTTELYEFDKREGVETRIARRRHYERERRKGADI